MAGRGSEVKFRVVIPARYASSRLPGKPLRRLGDKIMLQHVYERAMASGAAAVVIATDDGRIRQAAASFGAEVVMTATTHLSGTDRLAEVVARAGYADDDIIVNLQGDEPMMPPVIIRQVAINLAEHPPASIATVCASISTPAELFDPNLVKVVFDEAGYALYFSRAPIPWARDTFGKQSADTGALEGHAHWRHIGMYAYRAGFLRDYVRWPPSPLEQLESLEQLRALWYGRRIHVAEAVAPVIAGVDTEADVVRIEDLLKGNEASNLDFIFKT